MNDFIIEINELIKKVIFTLQIRLKLTIFIEKSAVKTIFIHTTSYTSFGKWTGRLQKAG